MRVFYYSSSECLPIVPLHFCFIGQVLHSSARLCLLLSYVGICNMCPMDSYSASLTNTPHQNASLSKEKWSHYFVFYVWLVSLGDWNDNSPALGIFKHCTSLNTRLYLSLASTPMLVFLPRFHMILQMLSVF